MANTSALCTKLLHWGCAHLIQAVRAALWMPFPCLWRRRVVVKVFVFLSQAILFLLHLCGDTSHTSLKQQVFAKWFQDVLWECIRITTSSAFFFSKLFRLVSSSCFQDFSFNKMPTVLIAGVTAGQQSYLMPAVSAWGHGFLNKWGCRCQRCQ